MNINYHQWPLIIPLILASRYVLNINVHQCPLIFSLIFCTISIKSCHNNLKLSDKKIIVWLDFCIVGSFLCFAVPSFQHRCVIVTSPFVLRSFSDSRTELERSSNGGWTEVERRMNGGWTELERRTNGAWTELERSLNGAWTELERSPNGGWTEVERSSNGGWTEVERRLNGARTEVERRLNGERLKTEWRANGGVDALSQAFCVPSVWYRNAFGIVVRQNGACFSKLMSAKLQSEIQIFCKFVVFRKRRTMKIQG